MGRCARLIGAPLRPLSPLWNTRLNSMGVDSRVEGGKCFIHSTGQRPSLCVLICYSGRPLITRRVLCSLVYLHRVNLSACVPEHGQTMCALVPSTQQHSHGQYITTHKTLSMGKNRVRVCIRTRLLPPPQALALICTNQCDLTALGRERRPINVRVPLAALRERET